MADGVIICSSCGRLSPKSWAECHHCGVDFRDDAGGSARSVNRYYAALDAGYGAYPTYGYLLTIGCVIAILVVSAVFVPNSDLSVATAGLLLVLFGGVATGVSMILGGAVALSDRGFEGQNPPSRWKVLGAGALTTAVLAAVLGVVSVIPVVNGLVLLGLVVLVLSSPYLVYKHGKRTQVERSTGIAALFDLAVPSPEFEADSRGGPHASTPVGEGAASSDGEATATTTAITSGRDATALSTALNVLAEIPSEQVTEADREVLLDRLDGSPATTHAIATADNFVTAVANVHVDLPASEQERPLDRIVEAAHTFRSRGDLDAAKSSFEVAERLATTIDRTSYRDSVARELEAVENEIARNRFDENADELFDLVRSAERSLESGQYETALQRFQTVDERLASEFHGDSELERTNQELSSRLEGGLATAVRHRLLTILPDSPTDFERRLLDISLPPRLPADSTRFTTERSIPTSTERWSERRTWTPLPEGRGP
ncbi:MAG: hypothetical protein ABEJ61_08825 [Haloferacaceae archaeon]